MSAEPRTIIAPSISLAWLIRLAALLCFIAAFCVAEAWLTKGSYSEWQSAGLALLTLSFLA